ncbi:MAG: Jag N-terminal domain-containing protein [Candidatus Omnitrophica bacterium]|nr:Jag N-terminal domain-containing protein [Candidatus Omnitrophota bacterium]
MTPSKKSSPPPPASVEMESPTVQDAIAKSLAALRAKRNQVIVKILSEGEKGLFGMKGASQAKVRVTLKSKA